MNLSLDVVFHNRNLIDAVGLIGLGMLALAAVRLARESRCWSTTMLTLGAAFLLLARMYFVVAPHVLSNDVLLAIGVTGNALTIGLPPLLLGFGLAGVVGGLWGHLRATRRSCASS